MKFNQLLLLVVALCAIPTVCPGQTTDSTNVVDYPIAYVRVPRSDNPDYFERWQDVQHPIFGEPGSDLVIHYPDGTEKVLVDVDQDCIMDPAMSLDGKWVYYSRIYDVAVQNESQMGPNKSHQGSVGNGADIYRTHVDTGETVQLTYGELATNTTAGFDWTGVKSYNTAPCPVPGGRVVFTSDRAQYQANGGNENISLQLWIMDDDGKNVEMTGHLNLGSILHPRLLADGRIMWSSMEGQGYKSTKNWSLWASKPDVRTWEPIVSSFAGGAPSSFHWQTQLSDTSIVTGYYYNLEFGMGTLMHFPLNLPQPGGSPFLSPDKTKNPVIIEYKRRSFPYSRVGLKHLTPWAQFGDVPSFQVDGVWLGKVGHPATGPNMDLLLTVASGPVHRRHFDDGHQVAYPKPDGGVYVIDDGSVPAEMPGDHLIKVVDSSQYNEIQPVAVLPWASIYGNEPPVVPYVPNDGDKHPMLPKGTPFGLIGTSSFYAREDQSRPGYVDWSSEIGAVSGEPWTDEDIHSVRIVGMEPSDIDTYNHQAGFWETVGNERLRNIGEVPLRKYTESGDVITDSAGDPDTSFLARIPADTAFTFQMLDKDRRVLSMAQTWHQLRPGEIRYDCRGCHAHHEPGIPFEGTAASLSNYDIADFTTPGDIEVYEYWEDVYPILQTHCQECHKSPNTAGGYDVLAENSWKKHVMGYRSRESALVKAAWGEDGIHSPIPEAQQDLIAVWVDLGAAANINFDGDGKMATAQATYTDSRVKADAKKPTLYVAQDELLFSAYDYETGVDRERLSVTADFNVADRAPGVELIDLFTEQGNIWTISVPEAAPEGGTLTVQVFDNHGHKTEIARTFRTTGDVPDTDPDPEPDDRDQIIAEQAARIEELESQNGSLWTKIQNALEALQ